MSSHDIIKQSGRIAGIIKNDDKKLKHKIGEILIEMLIIVFAISLSLFLERWRQNVEDHHLETSFLQGLKIDLTNDVNQLETSSAKWIAMKNSADYFLKPEKEISWTSDSINHYGYQLFHNVYFFPSKNRYEGLKSTGKLDVIKDEELQNNIIDLYQTKIPDLEQQVSFFNGFLNSGVTEYLIDNFKRDSNNRIILDRAFFTNAKTQNILDLYSTLDDILKRADSVKSKSEKVLKEINQILN